MVDKRKTAEIILQAIDDHGPVQVDWNMKEFWISAILRGLTMADLSEIQKPRSCTSQGINLILNNFTIPV